MRKSAVLRVVIDDEFLRKPSSTKQKRLRQDLELYTESGNPSPPSPNQTKIHVQSKFALTQPTP